MLFRSFLVESQLIAKSRELNNYKAFWCAEKIKSTMLEYEIKRSRKPVVAIMGLAFKPNIDDLRKSPAKYITQKVMQSEPENLLIVEPNIHEHPIFKLTDYQAAYERADIVVFLVAHKEFKRSLLSCSACWVLASARPSAAVSRPTWHSAMGRCRSSTNT